MTAGTGVLQSMTKSVAAHWDDNFARATGAKNESLFAGNTCCARAVDVKFVAGRSKTLRQFWPRAGSAPFQIVEFPAFIALEVMVMLFAGHFITCGIAGHFNRL